MMEVYDGDPHAHLFRGHHRSFYTVRSGFKKRSHYNEMGTNIITHEYN